MNPCKLNIVDISVVLATYNGEKFLKELMDSVLAQKDVNIKEFIIIDDCSTDNSYNLVADYQIKHDNIRLIKNEENIGPIGSFIKSAKLATANYIAFADQDDIWLENKLFLTFNLIKDIESNNKASVVFTDLKLIDENGHIVHDSFWTLLNIRPSKNNFFTLLYSNIATGCTMLINREMLNEFINMPLNAQMHDHWIALIGASFGNWTYSNEKTVLYRIHSNSVTLKNRTNLKDTIINFLNVSFLKKNVAFLENFISQALLFKIQYEHLLSKEANLQLSYFVRLKGKSGLAKKLNSKFRFFKGKWLK